MALAPGGLKYSVSLLAVAAISIGINPVFALVVLALAVSTALFYRDPTRSPPADDTGIIAPADGRVSVLRDEDDQVRLGIFMNVWDVHVNRAPQDGTVTAVTHHAGAHKPAFSKESDRNERVRIDYETPAGESTVTLIAGAFARRIHPYVTDGDTLTRGDRIGHISFGSRVDVCLPATIDQEDLTVERGDRVKAGETIIADISETSE